MLTVLLLLSVLTQGQSEHSARTPVQPSANGIAEVPGLDLALARLAAKDLEFSPSGSELSATNRAQDLRVKVGANGLTVRPGRSDSWRLALRTRSISRDAGLDKYVDAGPGLVANSGSHVQIDHGGWSEWFENRQDGIEQGWTIGARPPGEGPIFVQLEVAGDLSLRIDSETGGGFYRANGELALRYTGLKAADANGRMVRAALMTHGGGAAIKVDDTGVAYPITIDPVIAGPVWTYESNVVGAQTGQTVCYAGDVNGDGYGDVLTCSPGWPSSHSGHPNFALPGRVHLFLGSAAGLSSTPVWYFEAEDDYHAPHVSRVFGLGDVNGDGLADFGIERWGDGTWVDLYLGHASGIPTHAGNAYWHPLGGLVSVDRAGDINGDGYDDLVLAGQAYGYGVIKVFEGGSAGISNPSTWFNHYTSGQAYPLRAAGVGDINGDGYADVVAGSPNDHGGGPSGEGIVFVFYCGPTGLPDPWSLEIDGGQANLHLGSSVARAGDVNGDGYADVLVESASDARLYLGSSTGLSTSPAWSVPNTGLAVTAGDVNGDGYADVMVGDPSAESVSVYLGGPTGLSTTAAWVGNSGTTGSGFGSSVSGAGDVNGDGFGDLIVGAPTYSNGQTAEGCAYCYQGSAAGMSSFATWSNPGSQSGGEYGVSVALVGDLNADGFSDYVVGADREDSVNGQDSGRAYVYLGADLFTLPTPAGALDGPSANAEFGNWVAAAGDVNGDGYDDFLVGSRAASNGESGEGMVFVYYGSATGFNSTPAIAFESNQVGAGMGQCVASAGDINGDGYSDVLIGTFKWDGAVGMEQGRADLYLGSASGLGSTPAWSLLGQAAGDRMGSNVAGAGDVNGDGYSDFLVSAYSGGGSGTGYVRCFLGSATGPVGPVWSYDVPQLGAHVGSISSCGDVNGDGYSDIVIGSPQWDGALIDEGQALVFYGGPSGPAASPSWSSPGGQTGCFFGTTVASAGDVNGDGYSDLLVTAVRYDDGQTDEGAAFVYLGSATGLAATPVWTAEGNQDGAHLGVSATGPGDVNGDGFSDVLLGSMGFGLFQQNQGSVSLFLGNGAVRGGSPIGARPVTLSGTPLALLDKTPDVMFKIRARANGAQATSSTPGGRGRARRAAPRERHQRA